MIVAPHPSPSGKRSWYVRSVAPLDDAALRDSIVLLLWEGPKRTRMEKSASEVLELLPSMHPDQRAEHWQARRDFVQKTVADLKKMYEHDNLHGLASRLQIMYVNLRPKSVTIYSPKVMHKTPHGAGIDLLRKVLTGPLLPVVVMDLGSLGSVDFPEFGEFSACFEEDCVVKLGAAWIRGTPEERLELETRVRASIGDELLWEDAGYLRALDVWDETIPSGRVKLMSKKSRDKATGIEDYQQARMDFDTHYIIKFREFSSKLKKKRSLGGEGESRISSPKRKKSTATSEKSVRSTETEGSTGEKDLLAMANEVAILLAD